MPMQVRQSRAKRRLVHFPMDEGALARALAVLLLATWLPLGGVLFPGEANAVRNVRFAITAPDQGMPVDDDAPSSDAPPSFWSRLTSLVKGIDAEAIRLYAKWVIGAPVLVVAILLVMLLRPRRAPKQDTPASISPIRAGRTHRAPAQSPRRTMPRPTRPGPRPTDQQQVLRFFLQLFKAQQNAEVDAPAQIVRTETRPTCPDETYEMRILVKDDWVTRRMSLGLLGQGGGSRSKCFYVIYDTHMVIKIPPAPLVRFSDYKRQVAAEGRIVERLAPRQCIVPRISIILQAVHNFPDSARLTEEQLEFQYMRMVEYQPQYQEHLKIGDTFVFFMDLAKHFFLSTVLDEIHGGYGRLIDEARQHPELLWDQHAFVCRYGEDAGSICHALQDAYYRCEPQLRQLVDQAGGTGITTYHLKQWFMTHMAGETIQHDGSDLPAEVIHKANQLLEDVVKSNRLHVERYRHQLKEYIHRTRFTQYRRQVESLATNILDLLAWIGEKGLALRDLKPENLFVAGNPDEYPGFLNTPQKFSIGLIDVETAVPIDAEDPVLIPQPQLAGTPLYATPPHLISNAILMEVYEDLAAILHLQDWYATLAMLFKLITGEALFGITAHVFPDILTRLKIVDPAGPDLEEDIIHIQGIFWSSALAEFESGISQHATTLASVEVAVPPALVDGLLSGLESEIADIEKMVAKAVADQSFFNSGDKRRFLEVASSGKISQMKSKLNQEMASGSGTGHSQGQVLLYFEILEELKERLERKQRSVDSINTLHPTITADQLLEVMFKKVYTTMYPADWPTLTPRLFGSSAFLATDVTTYQATM